MRRRDFLRTSLSTTAFLIATPSWAATDKAEARASEREILSESGARIEERRKGQGVVVVQGANGRPVPGVKLKVEQLRHDFLFGCNFFNFGRCGETETEEKYRQQFAALFNYCTLGFYWRNYEREQGKPGYEYTDQALEWTREKGIASKGHPLVWDHPAGSPSWLPDDLQQIEQLSHERVRAIVARFKGRIDIWDVVNEPTHLPDKANKTKMAELGLKLGPVPYTTEPLKIARAANADARLLVNDYRVDKPYFELLKKLHEGARRFDVVGIQSHMHGEVWPLRRVWEVCDNFSKLGLPLHFTETTIVSGPRSGSRWSETTPEGEARQAEKTVGIYRALFAHPAVQAITWWDFSDLHAWQGAAAGWLRQDMSPKPVYEQLLALIKGQWWTRLEGETIGDGKFTTRAFFGTHRITVQAPNRPPVVREVRWQHGQKNEFVFRLT